MVMIIVFGVWGVAGAERPGLSENKWLLGIGNQGLEFGGSLALSDTKSVFASVGWMDVTLNDVPLFPFPFIDVTGLRWVVASRYHIKSTSLSLGYRLFRHSNVETRPGFLFGPSVTDFKEEYWSFLIKKQSLLHEGNILYFDAYETKGLSEKSFITPAFGVTHVYRHYSNGQVGSIKRVTNALIGFNMNTDGERMYPMPQIAILFSTTIAF